MILYIIISIVVIGAVAALGVLSGVNWKNNCGTGMGKKYMKEFGLEEEEKDRE